MKQIALMLKNNDVKGLIYLAEIHIFEIPFAVYLFFLSLACP